MNQPFDELTILLVDDRGIHRKLLRAQLEAEGHAVVEAVNGVEALEMLDHNVIDLVISDILMPVMDGYRLCYEIRRSERHFQLPIIIYTASYVSPSDEKLSFDLGADRYLRKPAPADDIKRAIREALAGPRRQPTTALEPGDVLGQYSERLVAKLEKKNIELIEAARRLNLQAIALETAADAILITDAEGVILWVNPAFTTTTGYTAEEAIGNTPRILKSGRHDDAFYREFWRTIRGGQTWRSEFANRRKDGTVYYDEHTVTPVRGQDGTITHFIGVMHDITDRKRAEEQLLEAHAQLQQILEHSPAVLYALRVDGDAITPRLVSANIKRLLGFEPAKTMTFVWWQQGLHPNDRTHAEKSIAETLAQGVSHTEYRMRHKDGSYRWVEDNRRLIRDRDGRPEEIVGAWVDISERKHVQDELAESERRFREMLNHLELVAMMLDRAGRITYCNDYFLHLTGWPRDEALGTDWFEHFLPDEEVAETREVFAALIAEKPEAWHHEDEIVTRSGRRRLIRWNNSVIRSASGQVIGTASIGEDVTDRRSMEMQLFRTQRLESLGTLAGGIAHDLNNLLMPILMGVSLLKRLGPSAQALKAMETIELSVKRGSELVRQVLLFSRGAETSRGMVDLREIIREVEMIISSTFPKNNLVEISVSENLHAVSGDTTQLTQILLNLCVNARDAMPQGGVISISASNAEVPDHDARMLGGSAGGPHVVLEVNDTGEGMSHETLERIFDPFFTTKEVGKGTGLGLSTVQGIVIRHGGFVTVSSDPGAGTTFRVHLPIGSPTPAAKPVADNGGVAPAGNGEWILVVDDESSVVTMTKQALEAFGYRVLTAEDGAQAIDVYSNRHKDVALVVTDMVMPMIDGPALIAALKRINSEVRIIAMTGSIAPSYAAEIAKMGVADLLAKPYTTGHLLRTIAGVLSGENL